MDNDLISKFHDAFFATRNDAQQQAHVIRTFSVELQKKDRRYASDLAADAAAMLWLVEHWGGTHDGPAIRDLEEMANKAPKKKTHGLKHLIARWSGEIVQHYRFDLLGERALRQLVRAAEQYGDWHDFVSAANSAMLWRQERYVRSCDNDKNKVDFPIGLHPPACKYRSRSRPLLPSDIDRIREGTCKGFATPERLRIWTTCGTCLNHYNRCEFSDAQNDISLLLLNIDSHGMLVPSRQPQKTCAYCCRPPPIIIAHSKKRKGVPGHSPGRAKPRQEPTPSVESSLSPPSSELETQFRLEDAASSPQNKAPAATGDIVEETTDLQDTQPHRSPTHVVPTPQTFSSTIQYQAPLIREPLRPSQDRLPLCTSCGGQCQRCEVPDAYSSIEAAELFNVSHLVCQGNRDSEISSEALLSYIRFAEPLRKIESASSSSTPKVWILPWDEPLKNYLETSAGPLPELLVIRGEQFSDSRRYSPAQYAQLLRLYCGGKLLPTRVDGDPALQFCDGEDIASHLVGESDKFQDKVVNVLSVKGIANAIKPSFTRMLRFCFLQALIHRVKAEEANGNAGKQTFRSPFDVSSCTEFNILGFSGAYSGAHVDLLGATWLRNLFGKKLWWYVPRSDMSDQDWTDFARYGSGWNPKEKAKAVLLNPGDVLVMFEPVVHLVFTVETCLMEGGMFCDSTRPVAFVNHVKNVAEMPNISNEPLSYELPLVIKELEEVIELGHRADKEDVKTAIRALRNTGCSCKTCGPKCACRLRTARCTRWCERHPTVPDKTRPRQCMTRD